MASAEVASVGQRDIVEEPAAVGLFRGLQPVEQPRQKLALGEVALLGTVELLGPCVVVVAHVVRKHLDAQAGQQRADGLPVGDHPRAVGLEGRHQDVVHQFDFLTALQAGLRLAERGRRLRHADPLLVLRQPCFDVADAVEIFLELGGVTLAEAAFQIAAALQHRVEHAPLLGQHRLLLLDRRFVLREEPMKGLDRSLQPRHRLAASVPRQRQARPMP